MINRYQKIVATGLGEIVVAMLVAAIALRTSATAEAIKELAIGAIFLVPASVLFWTRSEARTVGEWCGLSAVGLVGSLVFVWFDCGASGFVTHACASGGGGFSFLLTVAVTGYTIACIGGAVRAWVLAAFRQ